ncbi:hypothetical protein ACT453_58620, partial [Bacillus sp. D-CC]
EDCIILDNKDEAGLVWKQIERGAIIEVQYGKDRSDIVGVQLVGDREPYEISDKFDRNTISLRSLPYCTSIIAPRSICL